MRRLILIAAIMAASCGKTAPTKPGLPAQVIKVYVPTYVPIPKSLTKRCAWPKGKSLLDVIEVAKARRVCNETYERQLDAVDAIQGAPVP